MIILLTIVFFYCLHVCVLLTGKPEVKICLFHPLKQMRPHCCGWVAMQEIIASAFQGSIKAFYPHLPLMFLLRIFCSGGHILTPQLAQPKQEKSEHADFFFILGLKSILKRTMEAQMCFHGSKFYGIKKQAFMLDNCITYVRGRWYL